MRYKATIAYNGTNFAGWQIQKNATTIQEAIQKSMTELFKQDVSIIASGRTDAGVHALGQVIHFDLDTKIQPEKIPYILNANIDKDIQILDCCEVKEDFHARYSAKEKTYEYKMYVSRVPIPIFDTYAWRLVEYPNVGKMKEGMKYLEGEHDFRCFMASGSSVENTVRRIFSCELIQDRELKIIIKGNGFLYNMVRTIVGTLVDIGYGKHEPTYIKEIIEKKDRTLAGKTAPAKGLCLIEVQY